MVGRIQVFECGRRKLAQKLNLRGEIGETSHSAATLRFGWCYQLRTSLMQTAKIILLIICVVMGYGIIHDQITARVCIEYFTIAHPALFHTQSPSLIAFGWGVFATSWIGLVFGMILARASQSEGLPAIPITKLVKPIFILLGTMTLTATLAAIVGFELSRHSLISMPSPWARMIPSSQDDRFMAVWFAHGASYLLGLVGGTFLILRIWNQRFRPRIISVFPHGVCNLLRAAFLLLVLFVIVWLRLC